MNIATIYSNKSQECERAAQLLKALGCNFREYFLDEDFTKQQFQMEFGGDAHYPQIALGSKPLGGLKDALQYLKQHGYINWNQNRLSSYRYPEKKFGVFFGLGGRVKY